MKSVLKDILGAVLGYVVMFAVSFPLFSLMWVALGADGSFQPGSWQVSGAWVASSIVLGGIVSTAGGFACSKVAASRGGVAILVGLVILFAVLSALPDQATGVVARPDGVSMFDAMTSAQQPSWMMWFNPVIGVIGVLFGASLEEGRRRDR